MHTLHFHLKARLVSLWLTSRLLATAIHQSLCGDSGIVVAEMAYHHRHVIPCVLDAAKVIMVLQVACGL